MDAQLLDIRGGIEVAAHTDGDPIAGGLEDAGSIDGILRAQRFRQLISADAAARQLARRKVDIHDLVLDADQVYLAYTRNPQQLRADRFHPIAPFPVSE